MGKGQPDRANLGPAWRETVEYTPRDHQVGFRIVMAQREAGSSVHPRGPQSHGVAERPKSERERSVLITLGRRGQTT